MSFFGNKLIPENGKLKSIFKVFKFNIQFEIQLDQRLTFNLKQESSGHWIRNTVWGNAKVSTHVNPCYSWNGQRFTSHIMNCERKEKKIKFIFSLFFSLQSITTLRFDKSWLKISSDNNFHVQMVMKNGFINNNRFGKCLLKWEWKNEMK